MLPEETPTPVPSPEGNPDRMSILEARLAEIRSKQDPGDEPQPATPAAPALSETPADAAVPPAGGATQTEINPLVAPPKPKSTRCWASRAWQLSWACPPRPRLTHPTAPLRLLPRLLPLAPTQ